MKKKWVIFGFALSIFCQPIYATGIPTIDALLNGTSFSNLVQSIQTATEAVKQTSAWKNRIQTLTEQTRSLAKGENWLENLTFIGKQYESPVFDLIHQTVSDGDLDLLFTDTFGEIPQTDIDLSEALAQIGSTVHNEALKRMNRKQRGEYREVVDTFKRMKGIAKSSQKRIRQNESMQHRLAGLGDKTDLQTAQLHASIGSMANNNIEALHNTVISIEMAKQKSEMQRLATEAEERQRLQAFYLTRHHEPTVKVGPASLKASRDIII